MKQIKKLLLPVILVVISIMAIIIPASQIYKILSNDKIIDNSFSGVQGEEDVYDSNYGVVSQEITIQLYSWNDNGTGTFIDNYLNRLYFQNDDIYNISVVNKTDGAYLTITLPFTINKRVSGLTVYSKNKGMYNTYRVNSNNIELHTNNNVRIDSYEQSYNGETNFTITITSKKILDEVNCWYYPELTFYIEASYYDIDKSTISKGRNNFYNIPYNELLQKGINYKLAETVFLNEETDDVVWRSTVSAMSLSEYFYNSFVSSWRKGKETATILCSIGEYYNKQNELSISTKNNNLPMLFNIGDLVIPYIPIENGKTSPLSIKQNGKEKIFKVTQVRPYFDGAFWQELQLQEYNEPIVVTRQYICVSSDQPVGGIIESYEFETEITINDLKIINVWIGDNYYKVPVNEEGKLLAFKGAGAIEKISENTYKITGYSSLPNDPVPVNICILSEE